MNNKDKNNLTSNHTSNHTLNHTLNHTSNHTSNHLYNHSSLEIKKLEEYINTCNKYIEEIRNRTIKIEELVKKKNLTPEQRTNIFLNAFKNKTPEEWIKQYQTLKSKAEDKLRIIREKNRLKTKKQNVKNIIFDFKNKKLPLLFSKEVAIVSSILIIIFISMFTINFITNNNGIDKNNFIDNAVTANVAGRSGSTSITSYDTNIKLLEEIMTPVDRQATYKILNEKDLDVAWIVTTPGTTLRTTIKDSRGESVVTKTKIIGSTNDFIKDWNEGKGVFKDIKSQLKEANSPTNLEEILPINKLAKEPLVIHEYKHPRNTWAYIESWSPPKSGKILFLDPAIAWWDSTWNYRQEINITNNQNNNYTNELIVLNLDNTSVKSNFNWNNANNSLRFTSWNKSDDSEINLDFWIEKWNSSSKTAKIWVKVNYIPSNITNIGLGNNNGTAYLNMYYDNDAASITSNETATFNSVNSETASYNSTLGAPDCDSHTEECKATSSLLQCNSNQGAPGPEPNPPNTIDSCADSSTSGNCHSDESVENITITDLNGTAFKVGDTIQITGNAYCYSNADYIGIYFTDDVSTPNWARVNSAGTQCSGAGYESFSATKVITSNNDKQAVRIINKYNSELTSACDSGNYVDKDDLAFNIISLVTVTKNFGAELNNAYVNTTITSPSDGSIKYKGTPFTLDGLVNCSQGDCTSTNASIQFLSITSPSFYWIENDNNDFSTYNTSNNISFSSSITLENNSEWWDNSWQYKSDFNLTNNVKNLTNYNYKLILNNSVVGNNFNWTNSQDNNSLRFVYFNGSSYDSFDYWIENWNRTSKTGIVWIRIPFFENSTTMNIDVYYKNDNTNSLSNKNNVFQGISSASYNSTLGAPICIYYSDDCSGDSSLYHCQGTSEPNNPNTIDTCTDVGGTCGSDEAVEGLSIVNLNETDFKTGDTINITVTIDCYSGADYVAIYYTNSTTSPSWTRLTSTGLQCSSGNNEDFSITKVLDSSSGLHAVRGVVKYNAEISNECEGASYADKDDLAFNVFQEESLAISYGNEEKLSFKNTGDYISNVFDIGDSNAQLGIVYWNANKPTNTNYKVYVRSSSNNITWGSWFQEVNNTAIDANDNRYVQYKVELSTTNINYTPSIDEISIEYQIQTLDWTDMTASSSLSATNPYSCGNLNESNQECYPSWTITPKQVGDYNLKIRTSSSQDPSSFEYNNISLTVKEKTYILSYSVSPNTAINNDTLELQTLLVDGSSQAIVGANVTFYDVTNNTFLGSNLTDSNGYATIYYKIPESFILGTHNLNASYKGNSTLYYEKSNTALAQLIVSSTPSLIQQASSPSIAGTGETIRLSINASDEIGMDKVWVNVTKPDSSSTIYFMSNDLGQGKNGTYYYDFSDTWLTGTYVFKISANNTDGILIDPPGNFSINITGAMYIDPEKTEYKNYETVNLNSRRQSNWWNSSWKYRKTITVSGTNEDLYEYQVPLYINTSKLIGEGKLNSDCSDLRFVIESSSYMLPITIANNLSQDITDYPIKIAISDVSISRSISDDGSDIRIFTSPNNAPYESQSDIDFWFEGVDDNGDTSIWIKLNLTNAETTTLYMYYGKTGVETQSNYSNIFTTVIGEAGISSSDNNFNSTSFLGTYSEDPIVVSSLMTINDAAQAAARMANVTATDFEHKSEESVTLDGVHSSEEIGYLAIKRGSWLVNGKKIFANRTTYSKSGTTFYTTNFDFSFSSIPRIFASIDSYNEVDPVHLRFENAAVNSFDAMMEETRTGTQTHVDENVSYIAIPNGNFEIGQGNYLKTGQLSATDTPTTISYGTMGSSDPVLISKNIVYNGADKGHERINKLTPSVFFEEEDAYNGAHTTELFDWLAVDQGLIYGSPVVQSLDVSFGSPQEQDAIPKVLDYYLEGDCNNESTFIYLQVPEIATYENQNITMYYGFGGASPYSSLEGTFSYESPQPIAYVDNSLITTLEVYSLDDNNTVEVGSSSTSLDKRDMNSFSSTLLTDIIKATKPIQTYSSVNPTDVVTPISWAGTEFVYFLSRSTDIWYIVSPFGDANVTIYDDGSQIWNGIVNESGLTTTQDVGNSNTARITSDIPILVQHTATSSTSDGFPLYPATSEALYGVPTDDMNIGAGPLGSNVTTNSSDDTTNTINVIVANGNYDDSGNGNDGDSPAFRLIGSSPIGALQQADSDGTEVTTFLPESQMGTLFGSNDAVEWIAVATPNNNTNCTVYDNTGSVFESQISSGTNAVQYIGFGVGSDTNYISGGWIMECDKPVMAIMEHDSRNDEMQLLSYKDMRQYHYPEPSAFENSDEESVFTGLQNLGSTNITGYLYLAVETNLTGTWQVISPPIYQDISPRVIEPGTILNISDIWKLSGSWSTSTRAPGNYRVYAALRDPDNNIIVDSKSVPLEARSDFEIIEAILKLNNLTHENINEHSINEYEVGDKIDWINITVQAINNTAISAVIDLNLINASGDYPGWGPNSQLSCGNIAENDYCIEQWNNNSNGYLIPLSVSSGSYDFYWNVSINSSNGLKEENNSISVKIHNIPSTFSSKTSSTRVYVNGNNIVYTFNFSNLWSKNLTNSLVKINCPPNANLTCVCDGSQGSSPEICDLSDVKNNSVNVIGFNISANPTSLQGDFYVNVSLNYSNPGLENRSWQEYNSELVEVRKQGIIAITVTNYPTSITRNSGVLNNITMYINNTASTTSNNVYSNYTFPDSGIGSPGYFNQTPINQLVSSLAPNETVWHNLSFYSNLSTALGVKTFKVDSGSEAGQIDFKDLFITVNANTNITNISVSDLNVSKGESTTISARLVYDNGSAIAGRTINFYDTTDSYSIGSSVTNASGFATKIYAVPGAASSGLHSINVSFAGYSSDYILESNSQTSLDVGEKPSVTNLWTYPSVQSSGGNITIYANVSDDDVLTSITIDIYYPNGSLAINNGIMNLDNGDVYYYIFNNTWKNGTYNYNIVAYDNTGSQTENSSSFLVKNFGFIYFELDKNVYSQNENVLMNGMNADWWWNRAWLKKKQFNITSNTIYDNNNNGVLGEDDDFISNFQYNIILNTSKMILDGDLYSNCSDLRFIYKDNNANLNANSDNAIYNLEYYFETPCNSEKTSIWLNIPFVYGNNSVNKLEMYYAHNNNSYQDTQYNSISTNNISKENIFGGIAYVVSNELATSDLEIAAYYDNTTVCVNNGTQDVYCTTIDAYQTATITSGNLTTSSKIISNKAISAGFTYVGAGDTLTPLSWLGDKFVFPAPRGTTQSIDVVSPYANANVSLYNNAGLVSSTIVSRGGHGEIDYNAAANAGLRIIANTSILVHYEDAVGNNDFLPLYKESDELYGIISAGGNYNDVACAYDNTNVTTYYSNGTISYFTCNSYDTIDLGQGSAAGAGPSVYIVANNSIGGFGAADGDGTEAVVYLPPEELDNKYVIPQDSQYISIFAIEPSTYCALYNQIGTLQTSFTSTSYSKPRPQNVMRFTGSPIPAGYYIECNNSVYAYYEYNDQDGETNLLNIKNWRNYDSSNTTEGNKENYSSILSNTGNNTLNGYLRMVVQRNISDSWVNISTQINDNSIKNKRKIPFISSLDLESIWNTNVWNTGNSEAGNYRLLVELLDPFNNTITNDDKLNTNDTNINTNNEFSFYSLFDISEPLLRLNLTNIKIYDVTDTLNKHIYTGNLTNQGLNKTFILESDRLYRIEFYIRNEDNSTSWIINESDINHFNLNKDWTIDEENDIWYYNETSGEFLGGEFINSSSSSQANVSWNSSLGGSAINGSTIVFSYVLNLSNATSEKRQVHFYLNNSLLTLNDYSIFNILSSDKEPPLLFNNTYNISSNDILRGESTLVYARWNESISAAKVSYNSTNPVVNDYDISLSDPNLDNWTNYTISTTSLWTLGTHVTKIKASDLLNNWNNSLEYISFNVSGLARITSASLNVSSIIIGNSVKYTCRVSDNTNGEAINNYIVKFYNSTNLLGVNQTNSSGYASFIYTDNSAGIENIICNISANKTRYYKIDSNNELSKELTTMELEAPKYSSVSSNTSIVHKGESILLSTYWTDNFLLDTAVLSLNTSNNGGWFNSSSIDIGSGGTANKNWANFSYLIDNNLKPGDYSWKQFGNDSSNNINQTTTENFEVWGWAKLESINLNPASMYITNTTKITCRVIDKNNNSGINNYNVSFYNSTSLLGINQTNASGYANYFYTDNSSGLEEITCTITHDANLKYNITSTQSEYNKSTNLNTGIGGDITPPGILNENYGINDTNLKKGESILIYGQWNESINNSKVAYNSTLNSINEYAINPPFTNDWTNASILIASDWLVGEHAIKLIATDQANNINDSAQLFYFDVTATSRITWISPEGDLKDNQITLKCYVDEEESGNPISDYVVYFYNSTGHLLGTNMTDNNGYANLTINSINYLDSQEFSCRIFSSPTDYYYIGNNFLDSSTLFFDREIPTITLINPSNGFSTDNQFVTLKYVATDNHASNLTCDVFDNGNLIYDDVNSPSGSTIERTKSFSSGVHNWNVSCLDTVNNYNHSATWSFTVTVSDTESPNITLTYPDNNYYHGSSNITLEYNATDNVGLDKCYLYIDGSLNQTDNNPNNNSNNFTLNNLGENSYTWIVGCVDFSSNNINSSKRTFTVDLGGPDEFNLISPNNDTISKNNTPLLNWQETADPNFWNYTILISMNPDFSAGATTTYSIFNITKTSFEVFPLFMNQKYYWKIIAYDALSRKTESNQVFTYITDDQAPEVLLIMPPDKDNDPDQKVNFIFNPRDNKIKNCTLYTNSSGSWAPNRTITNVIANTNNNISISGFEINSTIIWNVLCYDSLENGAFANSNRTIYFTEYNETEGNMTIPVNVTVNNTKPNTINIKLDSQNYLVAGDYENISCNANITDINGEADILSAYAVMYHSSVSLSDPDDLNNHYTSTDCVVSNVINSTTKQFNCNISMIYHANPGTWNCVVYGEDSEGAGNSISKTTNLNELKALDVNPKLLDYGNIDGGIPSNESNTSIINIGNIAINISTWGYGSLISDNNAMICTQGSIPIADEKLSLSKGTLYESMTSLSGSSATANQIATNLAKQTTAINSSTYVYWRIASIGNNMGVCNGHIVLQAES